MSSPEKKISIVSLSDSSNNYNKFNNEIDSNIDITYHTYRRRWFILLIFLMIFTLNTSQWIQYTIISNIIMKYYGISAAMVNNTSIVYLITYMPLILPACYIINKKGLRFTILLAAVGSCIGTWIKVLSVDPDRFFVGLIGQTILSMSQLFLLSMPSKIAAVWFGPNQMSTACAIGVFGVQAGPALGFFITPIIVKNRENINDIGDELFQMFLGTAILATINATLAVVFFADAPPTPPSKAQAIIQQNVEKNVNILTSFKRLLTNRPFLMLLIAYGINIGLNNTISTLVNQLILPNFPHGEEFAGHIGAIIVSSGIISSVILGLILDKTKKYKFVTVFIYTMTVFGMLAFTFSTASQTKVLVYISACVLGFFMSGYLAVGYEVATELTYPESEFNSSGLLVSMSEMGGVLFTLIFEHLLPVLDDFWTNICMCGVLFCGAIITILTPNITRRQDYLRKYNEVLSNIDSERIKI